MKKLLTILALYLTHLSLSAQLSYTIDVVPICTGTSDTSVAYFDITGGTPPFSYNWSGPASGSGTATSDTLTGLFAGMYNMTVTDANSSQNFYFYMDSSFLYIEADTHNFCNGILLIAPNGQNLNGGTLYWSGDTLPYYNNTTWRQTTQEHATYYTSCTTGDGCYLADTFHIGNIPKLVSSLSIGAYSCDSGAHVVGGLVGSNPSDVLYTVYIDNNLFVSGQYHQRFDGNDHWNLPHGHYEITAHDTSAAMLAVCPDNYITDTIFIDRDTSLESIAFNDFTINSTIIDSCSDQVLLSVIPPSVPVNITSYDWYGSQGATLYPLNSTALVDDPNRYTIYGVEIYSNVCVGSQPIYSYDINFPDGFTLEMRSADANCQPNGSATATASNTGLTYSYQWDTGDTTSTINNLAAGSYWVTVTSSNGCIKTDSITVGSTSLTSLNVDSVTTNRPTCSLTANGSIQLHISATSQVSYQWSNGDTTSNPIDLLPDTYQVTITDTGGCSIRETLVLSPSGLDASTSIVVDADCATGNGASLTAIVNAGTGPYSYAWSNNATSDTITGLSLGGYTVTITDDNGCSETTHTSLDPSPNCFSLLSGKVYIDNDSSCTFNTNDVPIAGRMVALDPGYYAYTDQQGNWQALVAPSVQYKVYLASYGATAFTDACNIDTLLVNVPDTSNISGLDLPKYIDDSTNISIHLASSAIRPGFSSIVFVTINNLGANTVNGSGYVTFDNAYYSVNNYTLPPGVTIDSVSNNAPYIVYFSFENLTVGTSYQFSISTTTNIIPNVSIGQQTSTVGHVIDEYSVDFDLSNNIDTLRTVVVGSYDPNDKQVFSNEESMDGLASPTDTILEYLVRFQNTGTDTAFNVVIRDTLDAALDPATFRLLGSSHPVNVQFYQDRIIHFNFNNILLPDSNVNESLSHGFVAFEIEIEEPGLLQPISNQAAIYFDYNPPIYTNTVTSTRAETPMITGATELCDGETLILRADTLSTFNYIWTNNGNPIAGFTGDSLYVTTAGDYSLALILDDDTIWSASKLVAVNPLPTVSATATTNTLCEDASAISLNVSPAGGVLTGDGVSGTSFDPATAGVGAHQLTYEYTDGNNCSAAAYETITVNAEPILTISAASNSLCEDASAVPVTVSPTGGVLSGDGVSGSSFDPSSAGAGIHSVKYEYADTNNCSAIVYETVTVHALPSPSLSTVNDSLCENDVAVSINVSPTGGVLTGSGVTGTTFDPTVASTGKHPITYEYTDSNNCSATVYDTLTVTANPRPTISIASYSFCENAQAVQVTVSPAGGVLSGDGVTGTSFDPATAGIGVHQLVYDYTDGNNCSATQTKSITINANPTATFSLPTDPFCEDDQALDVSGYVSPAGGDITGTGVTGSSLDIASAGTYNLTYTYTDNNGCVATAQANAVVEVCIGIEEAELPIATIHPNPTNGLVTISVEGRPIDQVVLLDVTGKQIQLQPILTVDQATIDLSDLASGMYMLHILSEGNWYTERVALQK